MYAARILLAAVLGVTFVVAPLPAAEAKRAKEPVKAELAPLPKPADIQSLVAHPTSVRLKGSDAATQLLITAKLAGTREQDLTGDVTYEVADTKIVRVTSSGRVMPIASGKTTIQATYGTRQVSIPVQTEAIEEALPINFGNQIVPVFTKLGCNTGGCHGKLSGQNGFHLSLLGFEPEVDYSALVKEARGRRVSPSAPENSLLLQKATGTVAHGGGKRMEVGSDEYKLIRRWIASGLPVGDESDPVVTHIEVVPGHRVMTRQNKQQLAVYAHYNDGSVEDITRRAQYESNDQEIAAVDSTGLVHTLALSGEAAMMIRYQSKVTVFRATVPLGLPIPEYQFEPKTIVDKHTHKKWQELGIVPAELAPDDVFCRRAYLDITGTLPTTGQLKGFLADSSADKRDKLIDALVDSSDHAYFFANKWADILRVKRGNNQQNRAFGTFVFHDWIRESIANDRPYDQFARAILAAVGDESKCPPTVWYKDVRTADEFVDNASQVFLGTRMQCAQCHHHPYEKWGQDDYWGLAAFYGRVSRKTIPTPGLSIQNQQNQRQMIYVKASGTVINKRTGKTAEMKALDGPVIDADGDLDPRHKLVDWMVDAKNPFFAKAVANRYWAHFFGRGIVDPLDDMRVTNPPSNPELLDALAQDLVEHKYSLKHMVKTICKSRTYQLSSMPNEFNKDDRKAYARYYPRRMTAEVLFDAVNQVTNSPTIFQGLPQDTHAPKRAIMLPDESFASYFLDVFGRPQRLSACECERVTEANLAQVLHLLNSEEVQGKIARAGGRAETLAKDPRPDEEKIEELFLWAVGQKPTPRKMEAALADIERHAKDKKAAYENIIWALLNTKAFSFNQ
jgi:hypothetical protein